MLSSQKLAISTIKSSWRSFRIAAWLGWQIESNWADPFLFAIYSLVKPLAGAAIIVVMFAVITQSDFDSPVFTYMYLGNAFYIYVGQIMNGISWSVIDDREHYKTLKYIYTAPIQYRYYLLGRGVAQFLIASISVLITLAIGILFLHVQISIGDINFLLFIATMSIGIVMLVSMGLILAGAMLLLVHHAWEVGGLVASALFLFSGAVFPLELLPPVLRSIGYVLPLTYWLELVRRSLAPITMTAFPTFSRYSNGTLLIILSGLTLVLMIVSYFSLRWCTSRAVDRGLIDVVTNY